MSRELLHAASAAGYLRQASVCRLEPDRARRDEAGSRDATFQAAEDRCSLGRKGGVAIFALMVLFLQGDAGAEYAGVESQQPSPRRASGLGYEIPLIAGCNRVAVQGVTLSLCGRGPPLGGDIDSQRTIPPPRRN